MKKQLLALVLALSAIVSTQAVEPDFTSLEVSRQQGVLVLRINTPPRNAVSKVVLKEINSGLGVAFDDDSIGAVVITGTETVFSEGAGGGGLQKSPEGGPTQSVIAHEVFNRIGSFPKPVIAAISGLSAGGGNELAMACDVRIAGASAKFRQHELQAGLIPGFGGMQRLPRLIGYSRAMEIMLSGRVVNSAEALSIGLVSSVVADDKVVAEAIALGNQLAETLDKKALAVFKQRMSASYDESFYSALRHDQVAFDELMSSPDIKAAIGRFIERQRSSKK